MVCDPILVDDVLGTIDSYAIDEYVPHWIYV
jgi:hypothetical protein